MKSSLFLMEQLIAILVFAICASICVRIFVASFVMSGEAADMNNALIIARNGAECYKAVSGDAEKAAFILGGVCNDSGFLVYYDESRQPCEENYAVYVLNITDQGAKEPQSLSFGDLSVEKSGGEEILAFTVAARRE